MIICQTIRSRFNDNHDALELGQPVMVMVMILLLDVKTAGMRFNDNLSNSQSKVHLDVLEQ